MAVKVHQDDYIFPTTSPIPGSYIAASGIAYYFSQTGEQLCSMPDLQVRITSTRKNYDDKPLTDGKRHLNPVRYFLNKIQLFISNAKRLEQLHVLRCIFKNIFSRICVQVKQVMCDSPVLVKNLIVPRMAGLHFGRHRVPQGLKNTLI